MENVKIIGLVVIVVIIVVVAALLLMPPKERRGRPAGMGPSYEPPPGDQPPTQPPEGGDTGDTGPEEEPGTIEEEPETAEDLAIDLSDLGFENPGDESSPVDDTSILETEPTV